MSTEERRAPGAARIPFEGLVEVGGTLGPSFEAQAVNVSEEGMQIRTAYLPELGQQITCRFETSPGRSVLASGEVVWSRGADQGGEFGIRFTEVDPDSVEVLKRLCGFDAGKGAARQIGSKVRLYIDGLASPMRAKVRDAQPTAITVGSDLGFLQVGKKLELEDAQSGNKRPARIDRVDVAVDPGSQVPQLVVTLRYGDLPAAAGDAAANAGHGRSLEDTAQEAAAQMKGAFARQIAKVGPAFDGFTRKAKAAMAALVARRRSSDDAVAPRRTTAPAPGGGLRSSGRRVVRGDAGNATGDAAAAGKFTAARMSGRRAVAASTVLVAAVICGLALKKPHRDGAASAAGPAPSETAATAAAASVTPATTAVVAPPASSSTEATPPPASSAASATPAAPGTPDDAAKKHPKVASFSNGPVHHGNVLRLHMDAAVESIRGATQPMGFVVQIPGRKSLEAAAPLAARDSRIAAIKVTNEPSGAELTVTFKDGVPNYDVSARGDQLVIALAPAGSVENTVAKRDARPEHKHSKHHHESPPATSAHGRDRTPER